MVSSANSTKATSLVLSVPDDANDIGRGCFGFSFLSKLEPSNTRQPARLMPSAAVVAGLSRRTCYLVDPASSHMLVSKTKPCMCKNKQLYSVNLRTAHYISNNLFDGKYYMDNRSNSRANTCVKSRLLREGMYLLVKKSIRPLVGIVVSHSNCSNRWSCIGDSSFKFLPYQLSTVV